MDNLSLLKEIYAPEAFRKQGEALINVIADQLTKDLDPDNEEVMNPTATPEEALDFWKNYEKRSPEDLWEDTIGQSIKIHNPRYIGHQVCPPAPQAMLATLLGAYLNNGMAVYEMGIAASAQEKAIIDRLKPFFGYGNEADGIMTSGGTIANLTAILAARARANMDPGLQLGVMVSEQAHYCIDRAVKIMGWGDKGIVSVPVDHQFKMKTELLEDIYLAKAKEGIHIIAIVGSAPTTSTGNYDNIDQIGRFARKHNLWFHVDGAHGGAAAFSDKYRHLMYGREQADSITVDGHKMMMMPGITTMLFFKNHQDSYKTFAQKADYLFAVDDPEWHNYGKRTMECTKVMFSTRFASILMTKGVAPFQAYLETCYDLAKSFAIMIAKSEDFQLATVPDSNIICFRYVKGSDLNGTNLAIREKLYQEGHYYIVQTILKKNVFLRVTVMNPFTDKATFHSLLKEIRIKAIT